MYTMSAAIYTLYKYTRIAIVLHSRIEEEKAGHTEATGRKTRQAKECKVGGRRRG